MGLADRPLPPHNHHHHRLPARRPHLRLPQLHLLQMAVMAKRAMEDAKVGAVRAAAVEGKRRVVEKWKLIISIIVIIMIVTMRGALM